MMVANFGETERLPNSLVYFTTTMQTSIPWEIPILEGTMPKICSDKKIPRIVILFIMHQKGCLLNGPET